MTRPDLRLSHEERTTFLREVTTTTEPAAFAVPGENGYPLVGRVAVRLGDELLHLDGPAPVDGVAACLIIERGATYDDITAVIARGIVAERCLPLDDVISFAFGKLAPS